MTGTPTWASQHTWLARAGGTCPQLCKPSALTACWCPPPLSPWALECESMDAAPSLGNQSGNKLSPESKAIPAVFWCPGAELSPGAAPVAPVWHPRVAVDPCVPLDPLRSRSRSTRPGLALLLGPLNRALQPLPKSPGSHRCPCPTFRGTAPSGYFGLSTCLLSPATAALCQGLGWEGCR